MYDIRLEWFQGGGGAIIQLFWSATAGGLQKQIIPQSQLYPEGAPIIVTQPRSQTVEHGSTASFSVVASGTAPLSYQWRRNSDNLAGATQSTLVVTDVQRGQDATYSVRVSDGMNATTSGGAALTVTFTDSDNDGMNDIWEIANGLNANSSLDAALDSDSDGLTNKLEFLAGTDPRSAGSVLRVTVTMITGGAKVQFVAQSNKRYSVQYKNALNDPAWLVLQDVPAAVGPRDIAITDLSIGQVGARFYRVVVFGQ